MLPLSIAGVHWSLGLGYALRFPDPHPPVSSPTNPSSLPPENATGGGPWAASAPGRAEWLGNHTDYNDGLVLGLGLDVETSVQGRRRSDDRLSLVAADLGRGCEMELGCLAPVETESWANYVFGVAAGFLARGARPCGLDLEIRSTVPIGAGLSSSAALECSTARVFQQAWATDFDDLELARIGQEAEHKFAGVRCGLLDQVTSLFARRGRAVFLDCRSLEVERVPVPDAARFVIVQTGVHHALADGAYNARRAECEEAARVLGISKLREATSVTVEVAASAGRLSGDPLKRARHITGENARVSAAVEALRRGDLVAVGEAMSASHESSRTLFENSCAELDFFAAMAQEIPGCFGARLSGGGFGGAIIAMVAAGEEANFVAAMQSRVHAAWGRTPQCLVTGAGGPA